MSSHISNIAIYDPLRLKRHDFLQGFIARQSLFELILRQLRNIKPNTEVQKHHLLVGQRGMGKTSLLRRIGIEIEEHAKLQTHFIPLSFREEQ